METKVHLFCQAEESMDLSHAVSNSFATDLPSRNIDSKKYIKFFKTEKKISPLISPEIRGLRPEHKKRYEMSLFVYGAEKSSDKVGRKKHLQVQLHSKRTEIASSFVKLSKEKMARKENLCKLSNQYRVHKTSKPVCTSSSISREKEMLSNLYLTLYDEVPQEDLYLQELNVNGLLNFSDFLKAASDVSHLISQDPAFQDAMKIFCRLKGGRVATDEVVSVLESLDIFLIPDTFQEVIKYTYIDTIMEESALDETTSDRKLSKAPGCYLQLKKKRSSSSRLSEPSVYQKSNRKSVPYHGEIIEENDDLEFKTSKNTWQIKKNLDRIDSSDVGSQEPYTKDDVNFKKHSDKAEIYDSKSKPQSLKNISSLKKSLDKSDISSIPKFQKPIVRRHSSPLKQISSMEKTAINPLDLEKVFEAVSKLKENCSAAEEFQSILPSIGINLLDKEFQKIVKNSTRNVLTDAIKAIEIIKDGNVDCEDLNTCLQNFGIYLSKPEYEKITELIQVDEMGKVNFKEFIDTLMSNTERFSEKLLLPGAIENLNNLSKAKMNVSDLWNVLSSLNSNLKKDEFVIALQLATVDEDDKVQFEEVVKNMPDASRLEELKEVVSALSLLEGDMIAGKNLEDFLRNIGIKSHKEEAEKILQSDFVSEDSMVNVKDCLRTLKDTQKFSNFIALNEAINTVDCMKESDQSDKDKYSDGLENTDGLYFTDDTLQETLDDSLVEGDKDEFYNINIQKNDSTSISDLQQRLNVIGINLTDDEMQKTLDNTNPNNEVVRFKDFIRELTNTDEFIECQRIEDAWNIANSVSDGKVEVEDLLSILKSLEKLLNEEQLKTLLNSPTDERKMILNNVIGVVTNYPPKPSTPFNNLFKEISTLDKIRNDRMPVNELGSRLLSPGVPLSKEAFQEIL
ncbi:EF-hand calcium-binding domain-containing protein 13 [Choloepus didactylus]|uniref:EF-hand calcium-binding domain-containing protein 13 n=1 Tax=Choloepus didactylus TaxID=27675 RepID=UPI00189E8828|nr:EF-hand calcium-binding domain-containing protein 13 [Choloepus didactylus]